MRPAKRRYVDRCRSSPTLRKHRIDFNRREVIEDKQFAKTIFKPNLHALVLLITRFAFGFTRKYFRVLD